LNQLLVTRSELKYLISNQEYVYLSMLLKSVMDPDIHTRDDGTYYIRSLYFDSYDNKDYYTKDAGLEKRLKIRLRLYDLGSDQIKLEIKNKHDVYLIKETAIITREDAKKLSKGDIDCLLNYEHAVIGNLYHILKTNFYQPIILIDYEREAYVCDALGIRINFDKGIRASGSTLDLFDEAASLAPILEENMMVLEVKFNDILPDFYRDMLSSAKLVKTHYSKYCFARELI
jgi:hypothetical protein